mmetsp:Transcript_36000/g.115637  ORF Transcript_36000/g.115637 Transcript_36000/m.115637 type:complete len:296 (-) Transcript_36000:381-1268(-)
MPERDAIPRPPKPPPASPPRGLSLAPVAALAAYALALHRSMALDDPPEPSCNALDPHDESTDAREVRDFRTSAATSGGISPSGLSSGSGAPLYRAAAMCNATANSSALSLPSISRSLSTQIRSTSSAGSCARLKTPFACSRVTAAPDAMELNRSWYWASSAVVIGVMRLTGLGRNGGGGLGLGAGAGAGAGAGGGLPLKSSSKVGLKEAVTGAPPCMPKPAEGCGGCPKLGSGGPKLDAGGAAGGPPKSVPNPPSKLEGKAEAAGGLKFDPYCGVCAGASPKLTLKVFESDAGAN